MKKAYYADFIWFDSREHRDSWLLVSGQTIEDCVKDVPVGYEKVVFKNSSVFPAFINTHSHTPMVFLRGLADDLPLMEWLRNNIWPVEKKLVSKEFIEEASMLAAAEMIRSGTCCVNDMYFHTEVTADVYDSLGFRAVIGCGIMENPGELRTDFLANVRHMVEKFKNSPFINISLCPHAPYSVPKDTFEKIARYSSENGVIVHTHLAESEWEFNDVKQKYGMTPVEFVKDLGLLDKCKSVFAHCIYLTPEDIEIMGETRANVSHCIQSNLKLASGVAPIVKLMRAGANVAIGTDSAASNNDLDMLSEMLSVALVHKGIEKDAEVMNAKTVLECATVNGAVALGLENLGELKKGNAADFIVVSHDMPHMQPVFNPLSLLIYSAKQSDITDVFIAGKQMLKSGQLTVIDEDRLRYNSAKWKTKIQEIIC